MANDFDQFDPPAQSAAPGGSGSAVNDFDQFDPPAPSAGSSSSGSTAGDIAKGGGRGLLEGLTVDAATYPHDIAVGLGKGMDYIARKALGRPDPDGSEETAFDRAGQTLRDRFNQAVPAAPDSMAGRYSEAVGRALPMAVAMPGNAARNAVLQGALPAIASEAAGDATAGTGYEGAARVAGGLLGAGAGAAAEGVIGAAGRAVQPLTKAGQAQLAGERLTANAADPAAARAALEATPSTAAADGAVSTGQIVPGSQPTTAQLTGDMGLLSREKTLETENSVPFNDRRTAQNNARVAALPQSDGGAENLSSGLRNVLANLDDLENGKLTSARNAAQDAATGLGGMQSADFYGRQMQGAAQPGIDAAQGRVTSALDAMGGTGTPEEYGAAMRTAEQSAANAAKAHRGQLYRAIDPDGLLQAVNTPVKATAQQVAANLPRAAAPPTGEEAAILAQIGKMPDVVPFSELQALDSRINAASKAERMTAGESPVYGRLQQLKSGVQDAIVNAAEHQHAYEQQQIAAQERPAEISIQSRLADLYGHEHADYVGGQATGTDGPLFPGARRLPQAQQVRAAMRDLYATPSVAKAPQDLVSMARSAGGLKDAGGDLASSGLAQRFPGLVNNKSGVPLDRFREAAAEQGYLGADTEHAVANTDVNDLIDALHAHPTYSVRDYDAALGREDALNARDMVGRYKQAAGDLRDGLTQRGVDPRSAHPEMVHEASKLMVHQGLPWEDALGQAGENRLADYQDAAREAQYRASSAAGYQDPSLGDAGEGSGQGAGTSGAGASLRSDGEARPNFDEAAAERLRAAKDAHAFLARTYREGDTARRLKTTGFAGQYQMTDAALPNTVFSPGQQGGAKLRRYFEAAGYTPETQGAVRNYAAMSLRRAAVRGDGSFDPAAYQRWSAQHQDALRELPGGQQAFANVDSAQQALARFEPFTRGSAPSALPEMFFHSGAQGADGVRNLRGVLGDRAATSSLTDYAASRLRQHALNPDGTLDPRRVASFVKAHDPALSALPGLKERFQSAAQASETINTVAAQRKAALDAFQRESVGKIMGSTEPADITRMVGDVFGARNGVRQFKDLAAKAAQAGPDAVEGLRKAVVDHIMGRFISNREAGTSGVNKIAGNAFQTFVKQKSPMLHQVFSPAEVGNLEGISNDMARANRSIDAVHVPGQSQTAALRHKVASAEGHGGGESLLQRWYFLTHGVHELAHQVGKLPLVGEYLAPAIGHLGLPVVAAKKLLNAMQARGMSKVDDLEREAMLNPHVARELMYHVNPHNAGPITDRLAQRLGAMTPFYNAEGQQAQPARASGGAVAGDDDEPVAHITGEEIAPHETELSELRDRAKAYFAANLRGTTVHSRALGRPVGFQRSRKAFSVSGNPDKLRMFAALRDVVGKGRLVNSEPPKDSSVEPSTKAYHYIEAKVGTPQEHRLVGATVREDTSGDLYYNHSMRDEEGRPHHDAPEGTARKARPGDVGGGAALRMNVGEDDDPAKRAAGGRVEPSDAQKEAENYSKDHVRFAGLDVSVENAKGSTRSGVGTDGKRWSTVLPADYGYIKGTVGADGDHVDCYLGPDADAPYAWIVNQMDLRPRRFDEHKVMLGFRSRDEALETYKRGFSDGKGAARIGSIRALPMDVFKKWVKSDATSKAA